MNSRFSHFLLLISLVLASGTAAYAFRVPIFEMFLPMLHWIIDTIEQRFHIAKLLIARPRSEYVIYLQLVSTTPVELYGRKLPGMDVNASTLLTHGIQHIFIFLVMVLLAAFYSNLRYGLLFVLVLIALPLSVALDIPFTLLGSIEGLYLENFAPDQLDAHWLVKWEKFMTNGGRMTMALGLSLLVVVLSQKSRPSS